MKAPYIPASQIKRESVRLIPSPYPHNSRAVETSDGIFLIADNDHPSIKPGTHVLVIFDPEDQFATILS